MKITLITLGSPHLSFAKEGIAEYVKRLGRFADFSLIHVKENNQSEKKMLAHIGNDLCILLDEKGNHYSSREFANFLDRQKNQSRNISLVIGGPNGHNENIYACADLLWSLSSLTFPHDIAMMLTCEAVYRALTISAGHPYHRD